MITSGCLWGVYKTVGEAEEEGKCGGRRGDKEGNGIAAEGSNDLLSRKVHREVVG